MHQSRCIAGILVSSLLYSVFPRIPLEVCPVSRSSRSTWINGGEERSEPAFKRKSFLKRIYFNSL